MLICEGSRKLAEPISRHTYSIYTFFLFTLSWKTFHSRLRPETLLNEVTPEPIYQREKEHKF